MAAKFQISTEYTPAGDQPKASEALTSGFHAGKKVQVLDPTPTGDALLDEGLERFTKVDGKSLSSAISSVSKKLEKVVADDLAQRGLITVEPGGLLGLKPARYPVEDPQTEARVRAGLTEVSRTANSQGQTVVRARNASGQLLEIVTDTANRILSSRRL